MIDHTSIAVRDLKKGEAFYAALLAPLGLAKLREWPDAAIGFGKKYPEFWINRRAAMDRIADEAVTRHDRSIWSQAARSDRLISQVASPAGGVALARPV